MVAAHGGAGGRAEEGEGEVRRANEQTERDAYQQYRAQVKREAKFGGYDEAIMLDPEGYVSEASGENIFIIRDRKVKTTPLTSIAGSLNLAVL